MPSVELAIGPHSGTTVTYHLHDLIPGTAYVFQVRAFNSGGDSAPAVSSTINTLPDVPDEPTDLQADSISEGQVTLSWIDDSGNETVFSE